ncbi:uncharacterized protein LOC127131632 [Lathyrus oleraceus]|uniref:uncharacterized protein LOC127131632 n=1 Tax=Pisum sativum TaxID=3888 RepID=UPI0021D0BAD3|nr:uncharacterized protein LOC127131632 [Pisum sativum]
MNIGTQQSPEKPEENITEEDGLLEVELEIKETKKTEKDVVIIPIKEKEKVVKPIIKLPYALRQKKKGQHKKNFEKFLEMSKKLEIKIPFSKALEQMPIYAKFMKDIISKKSSTNIDPIILTETCCVILQGMKIPVKEKDRGYVTIPCTIGDRKFKKALIDLGTSVSLISLSIYKKLELGTVQDTMMTLQFADRSVKRPYGIMEDVLVKIDKFVFLVDFVILEMPEYEEIPLILGSLFFRNDEELKIDARNIMQYKYDVGTSHTVGVIDQVIAQGIEMKTPQLPLERVLSLSIFGSDENERES